MCKFSGAFTNYAKINGFNELNVTIFFLDESFTRTAVACR